MFMWMSHTCGRIYSRTPCTSILNVHVDVSGRAAIEKPRTLFSYSARRKNQTKSTPHPNSRRQGRNIKGTVQVLNGSTIKQAIANKILKEKNIKVCYRFRY